MSKPGCPFNHFGPCLEDKCKFYFPVRHPESSCAILASYAEALCANVNTEMIAASLAFLRASLGLPRDSGENAGQIHQLQTLLAGLKCVAGSLSVDPAVAEQAHICWGKVSRMLDILCEEEGYSPQDA